MPPPPHRVGEVAALFLRLGISAFGGPAAHIAMMEDEVVRRRGWLTHAQFLDLLGATNLIPGPNSTEMAIHIGHQRAGWLGLLVAGACFILPASLITLALAWAYVRFGTRPQAEALLYGIKPVIIAVVLQALWMLSKTAFTRRALVVVALSGFAAAALGINELVILLLCGSAAFAMYLLPARSLGVLLLAAAPASGAWAVATPSLPFSLSALFLFFLKTGSVLFGSGYVLLAFLRADLVDHWQWLTDRQLLDAVAVGQLTPGPVFTTATFIGYLLGGIPGALVATVGIFLPAFFFVAISGPLVPYLRRSPSAAAFLDGVIVASLALMAQVTFMLGRAAIIDVATALIFVASALLLLRTRLSSIWLIAGGAATGVLVHSFGW